MTRSLVSALRRHWSILLFLLANLAIAGPAAAGLKNAACWDPVEEVEYLCCERCLFFCGCDLDSP